MIAHVNFDEVRKGFENVGAKIIDTCLIEIIWADIETHLNNLFDVKLWIKVKKEDDEDDDDDGYKSKAQSESPLTRAIIILRDYYKDFEATLLESQWYDRLNELLCRRVARRYLEMFVNFKKPHKFSNCKLKFFKNCDICSTNVYQTNGL
jgi:hypothetical protein